MDTNIFIVLDVHKKTIAVATVAADASASVQFYGAIPNTPEDRRLYWNESHVGAGVSLADRFCIGGVCFVPLDVCLHILWRDQPHIVTKLGQLPPPTMGSGAGLDTDPASRQAGQQLDQAVSVHATSQRDRAPSKVGRRFI